MNKITISYISIILLFLILANCNHDDGVSDSLKIASYNIRYKAPEDKESGNKWEKRKDPLAKIIKNNNIDIVGTQEGDSLQMEDLSSLLPGYDYIAYPYGSTRKNGSHIHTASILYKVSDFEILKECRFWYSETPDEESIGWDATDLRICAWAKMKHKSSGQKFYFFTSHFYWRKHIAKENSGRVMVEKIKEIADEDLPIISTGDLNSEIGSSQITDITHYLQDARNITKESPIGPKNTNLGGGNFKDPPKNRIDYIFVNKKVQVLTYSVLTDNYDDGRYPSDHLPV